MSAPAANALPPAPRSTMHRSDSSRPSSRIVSRKSCHIALVSAFSRDGLLSVTVAMAPAREARMGASVAAVAVVLIGAGSPAALALGVALRPVEPQLLAF